MTADEQDAESDDGAGREREPPAEIALEHGGVEQEQRRETADGGTHPIAPVDRQVHLPPVACWDQLIDGRVDGRVLAADAGAGEEAEQEEHPRLGRERGGHRGQQVEAEREHEQLFAPVAVRELPEEQRAQTGAGDIDRGGRSDVRGVEVDAAAALGQPRGDRADDRDLEAVEDPYRAEPDDDAPVEARPRQPVEPSGNVGTDGPVAYRVHACHSVVAFSAIAPGSRARAQRCTGSASAAAGRLGPSATRAPRMRAATPAASTVRTVPTWAGALRSSGCSRCGSFVPFASAVIGIVTRPSRPLRQAVEP